MGLWRAHGVFYDNLATGVVDFGCTIDNYHGLFRAYRADDGDLDYYVFAGPKVANVTRRFSWLTGGQAFAPRWSLGFAMTSMTIADAPDADARISAFVADCETHGIRCDSFHFGSGYTSIGPRRYVFNWNREKFPDPAATMARLKQAGMQPVTNIKPCLLDDHPRLDEATVGGLLVADGITGEPAVAQFWDGPGFHIDFTNPKARDWWVKGLTTALLDYGVTSVWNDNNEYEIWDEDAVCAGDGRPFPQCLGRPAQPLLMHKLAYETQAAHAPSKRPHVISRGGGAGISRYGQTWTGDNETAWKTLRFNLTQGLNMSLSGLFNIGHDVGGFHGPVPGPELFCRFVEFCALWPRMVMNSWKDNGTVNLPWMHPEVLPQGTRRNRAASPPGSVSLHADVASGRRERARCPPTSLGLPGRCGGPRRRGCLHAGTGPSRRARAGGRDYATNPQFTRASRRLDHWHDGSHLEGGRVVKVDAPLGRLPLFARAGALIPVAEGSKMTLIVFGASADTGMGTLYVDDGETAHWRRDGYCIEFRLRREGAGFALERELSANAPASTPTIAVRAVDLPGLRLASPGLTLTM